MKRLLAASRLVTLTGPGGTGKTRLALRVAAEVRRAFPAGVWFVDLTDLRRPESLTQEMQDPDTLAYLIAAALGLGEQSSLPPLRLLADKLADRQMLLVLDNCEHVIPAVVILTEVLLRSCPALRVLATSREPLLIGGELLFAVPALQVPDPADDASPAELGRSEAVALFVVRAQAITPNFSLGPDNGRTVAALCRRLDGLPLAIELAAARIRVLSPQQILERMADRFALLSRGTRAAPERHRTLRACVEWSFELCAKPERILWARLSVFAGGCELDAIEGLCADELLPAKDVLDLVAGLLDKSILVRDQAVGTARYRLLETIREFGQERLAEAGEQQLLRRRHRDWYQELAARAEAEWISDRQLWWLARLQREHANLRVAVEYCLAQPGEAEGAVRIVAALPTEHWPNAGMRGEGRRWLSEALAQVTAPTQVRAQALLEAARLAFWEFDGDNGLRFLREGEDLARRFDDPALRVAAASLRGTWQSFQGDHAGASTTLEDAHAVLSTVDEPNPRDQLEILQLLAFAAGAAGDHQRAAGFLREILAISDLHGEVRYRSVALMAVALGAWGQGDLDEAAGYVEEGIKVAQAHARDDRNLYAMSLEILAWINAARGHHRRAATLLGAADGLWIDRDSSIHAWKHLVGYHHDCERRARGALDGPAFVAAFRVGRTMSLNDALAYALDESRPPRPPAADPAPPATAGLTRRERQVAELLAEGLSNKDIAGRLVIAQRTAESHVEHILTKLGFTNRAQVAAWISQHRADHSR